MSTISQELLTLGHGTATEGELARLIREAAIESIIDVRTVPKSRRHPQFRREEMERWVPEKTGSTYLWEPALGGFLDVLLGLKTEDSAARGSRRAQRFLLRRISRISTGYPGLSSPYENVLRGIRVGIARMSARYARKLGETRLFAATATPQWSLASIGNGIPGDGSHEHAISSPCQLSGIACALYPRPEGRGFTAPLVM